MPAVIAPLRSPSLARVLFALTAAVSGGGLLLQLVLTARTSEGFFDSRAGRIVNFFCFFTIQSNIIVAVTCALLAVRPDRRSLVFRVLRLDGLLAIAVTGIVFRVALSGLRQLEGEDALADALLHVVSPVLCVAGWLVCGPRRALTGRTVAWSLAFPLLWIAFTLVRGPLVDYYPYPFIDVDQHGYGRVAVNVSLVAVLFLAMAAGALALDRVLARGSADQVRAAEDGVHAR